MMIFARKPLSLWLIMLFYTGIHAVTVRAQTNKPILKIETGMHTGAIRRLSVDSANRFLVTASDDKTARVWDAKTGALLSILRPPIGAGDEGKLYAVAISPDGRTVVCGGSTDPLKQTQSLYVFDRATAMLRQHVTGLSSVICHLAYSPNGKFLAATLGRNGIRLYRTSDYSVMSDDTDYGAGSYGASFSAVGNALRLVTSCDDGALRLYDVNATSGALHLRTKITTQGATDPMGVAFSPQGNKIAVGFSDAPHVEVVSGADLSHVFTPDCAGLNNGSLSRVSWSADGDVLYAAGRATGEDGKWMIRQWSNHGQGSSLDIATSDNTILDLQSRLSGGVFFATYEPAWGIVDSANHAVKRSSSLIADFRANRDGFRISPDGSVVAFAYEPLGQSPALFSLLDRKLTPGNEGTDDLAAPVTAMEGLDIQGWEDGDTPTLNGQALDLKSYERSRCLTIAPDHAHFALGTEWYVRLFDKAGTLLWQVPVPEAAWDVNISRDGKVVVAALGDGTIRWYRMMDGQELLAFFPQIDKKRWIAWTPSGQYDCSPGADTLIGWHVNHGRDHAADFYPVARFFDQFYTPHLLARVLKGDVLPTSTVTVANGFKTPPRVQIISPTAGQTVVSDTVQITVQATDQGGGAENLRLFLNGKLVANDQKRIVETSAIKTQIKTFTVTLVPGQNTIRALASSRENIESNPAQLVLELKAAQTKPDLYILSAGIENYKNPAFALVYCDSDAQAFTAALEKRGKSIFGAVHAVILTDEQVTKSGLESAFAKLQALAKPTDVFVFYYSGHGVMPKVASGESEDFYLVCQDVLYLDGADGIAKKGLSAKRLRELSAQIKAQKQLLVLDACQSGGAIGAFSKGLAEETAIAQLAHSAGVMVLAASLKQQVAQILEPLKHSVFTYALLQGLSGDADRPPDGRVTVGKLNTYLNDQLPILTKRYGGETQYPASYAAGQDFPIGVH